jgi:prepilin-type N-terminal cleavage/methylation domain-containing protein
VRPLGLGAGRGGIRGFTLNELLVVTAIIVLLLGLAIPAFNAISGQRSLDVASNTISAYLGRARAEAIGLGRPTGVLFYRDARTGRVGMTIVQQADPKIFATTVEQIREQYPIWLDALPERETVLLPVGVGVQTVNPGYPGAGASGEVDRYLGFNARNAYSAASFASPNMGTEASPNVGGVILFGSNGQLLSSIVGLRGWLGTSANATYSNVAEILYNGLTTGNTVKAGESATDTLDRPDVMLAPVAWNTNTAAPLPTEFDRAVVRSQLGVALYDLESFNNLGSATQTDPAAGSNTPYGSNANEKAEEGWLDNNAVLLLVNRYNGTIIRGE